MSEPWAIALFTSVTGCLLVIAKCLWDIKTSLRQFVTQPDCTQKMCGHEQEIKLLRNTAIKNQRALSEIKPIIFMEHGIDIDVDTE